MKFLKALGVLAIIMVAIGLYGNYHLHLKEKKWEEAQKERHALSPEHRITVHLFIGYHSTSTEKIGFLMGKDTVEFWIPRNYLEDGGIGWGANFFRITTSYPDFEGANEGNIKQLESWHWTHLPNLIEIIGFESSEPNDTISISHDVTTHIFSYEEGKTPEPWQYGLYKSHHKTLASDWYLYPETKDRKRFYISCLPEKSDETMHTCDSHIRISDDVEVIVQYHRSLLPHAIEINDRVRQLLQSFIVNRKVNL